MTAIQILSAETIASLCDHTFLTPTEAYREKGNAIALRREAFKAFIEETLASRLQPYAVCVRTPDVAHVRRALPSTIVIAATVGFPDGPWHTTGYKIAEAREALNDGATEIDMVIDYEALKRGEDDLVRSDIAAVAEVVHRHQGVLKVILEISELTLPQTRLACQIAANCGVAFVKTSTGYSTHGASVEHLRVMRESFAKGVKISGSVSSNNVETLIRAATTLGQPVTADPMVLRIGESSLLNQLSHQG